MSVHRHIDSRHGLSPILFQSIATLVDPAGVVPALRASSKRQVLQALSRQAAALTGRPERSILNALLERERLGTTGVGQGVAIPHAKLPELDRLLGVFARLSRPIDFDTVDGQPVDLVFLLLAPEMAGAEPLQALARVCRLLRDETIGAKLRSADSGDALYAVLTGDGEYAHPPLSR